VGVEVDYDASRIAVAPKDMNAIATDVTNLSQDIANSLDHIRSTVEVLFLTDWKGRSQQEADELNNRWSTMMKKLFGTKEEPDIGVLSAIADGIGFAADNYGKAESGLTAAFHKFADGLSGGAGDKNAVPKDELDTNKTAITADY
jgi:uncharacterized protein YukE